MSGLSHIGSSTWNKHSNNLKTTTRVDCCKHGDTEVDIYS